MKRTRFMFFGMVVLLSCFLSASVVAGELKEGTIINQGNIDKIKNDTFEGHTIASLLTDKMELMIKKYNIYYTLKHTNEIQVDPRYYKATELYSKHVKYDPKTRLVTGYKAGWPFPKISMSDPVAGDKVLYNFVLGYPSGDVEYFDKFKYLFIDTKRGLERSQVWAYLTYRLVNRMNGEPVEGDGKIYRNLAVFALAPSDIKGLGVYKETYIDGRVQNVWAYVKSVRRTRRLSGGAWMDPIGGTDQLNDEIHGFDALPPWYPQVKLLGKRWILALANANSPNIYDNKAGTLEEYPHTDLKNPPYCNNKGGFEPREVYVVEVTTPKEHPESKKVIYFDTKYFVPYMVEANDRQGNFWKFIMTGRNPFKTDDGVITISSAWALFYDTKANHATIYMDHPSWRTNPKGANRSWVSLDAMVKMSQTK